MKIMKCVGSDVGLVWDAWTCSYWFPFPKRSRYLSVSSCKFPNKPVSYMGKWMIRMNWFGDGDYVFLSLSWSWELGRTAEARRFARLLEERDGLWKIGTVRIIWNCVELSKHVGGTYSFEYPWKHAPIPYGRTLHLECFFSPKKQPKAGNPMVLHQSLLQCFTKWML